MRLELQECLPHMPTSACSVRGTGSAQAAAQVVLEKPRVEALFSGASPPQQRALSRASASQPAMDPSFWGAGAERETGSELSVATTNFIPASQLGKAASAMSASKLDSQGLQATPGAATSSEASPAKTREPTMFQKSLPFRTDAESSVVSDWKIHFQQQVGKGLALQRGLRFQDLRYGSTEAGSPGVCVLKQAADVPKAPTNPMTFEPIKQKQHNIDAITKMLQNLGVQLTEPRPDFTAQPSAEEEISKARARREATRKETKVEASPKPSKSTAAKRSTSEASILSHVERNKQLPAVIARKRYQTYVVDKPKKGHRSCEPEKTPQAA